MKATKQNTEKSVQVRFLEILKDARKLEEKEQLPITNRLYKATVDKENLTVKLELEVPLSEVIRSARGSNYIVPIANEKGVRGSGIAQFVSDDGLSLKLYTDRVYVSTQAQEDDKKLKALSRNDSEKQLLKDSLAETKAQNAMLLKILKDKGLLD
jgi:hypothetical protein|nr:MAG TPA: hypothetical protein [Bacteriophage sp.]